MIKNIKLPLIGLTKAREIWAQLDGYPTENRVVIAVPADPEVKVGGLYLPSKNKEDIPRKGVIIQTGEFTEDYKTYTGIKVGDIVTYGMYAGKEIDPPFKTEEIDTTDLKFYVLSLSEIIYVEKNFNA